MTRREFVNTMIVGAAISLLGFGLDKTLLRSRVDVVRPPGAVVEEAFLSLCSRCGRCTIVCPNSALRLQGLENGLSNTLTPKLAPITGSCILPVDGCRNCIDSCPTQALQQVDFSTIGLEDISSEIKIGTAVLYTNLCIPYKLEQTCLACFEVCPVEGAITMNEDEEPRKPVFDEEACFGCGACLNACPAIPKAIVLTSKGEKRVLV
jgi:ferredoxin-type protein NapG